MSNIDFSQVVTAEDKAAAQAAQEREAANREARDYLAATDWYIVRHAETGEGVPQDITDKRAAARAVVVD